jgi:5S rRNA maturation endonuclease (ribonuclease M5)
MIDKRQKTIDVFGTFITNFVRDLNKLSEEGWSVLVEGQRDERALRRLGFKGHMTSLSSVRRRGMGAFDDMRKVVILTDLDREGAVLASRYLKMLTHEGVRASLAERRRLKHASKGVFLHIENLSRFADSPNYDGLQISSSWSRSSRQAHDIVV